MSIFMNRTRREFRTMVRNSKNPLNEVVAMANNGCAVFKTRNGSYVGDKELSDSYIDFLSTIFEEKYGLTPDNNTGKPKTAPFANPTQEAVAGNTMGTATCTCGCGGTHHAHPTVNPANATNEPIKYEYQKTTDELRKEVEAAGMKMRNNGFNDNIAAASHDIPSNNTNQQIILPTPSFEYKLYNGFAPWWNGMYYRKTGDNNRPMEFYDSRENGGAFNADYPNPYVDENYNAIHDRSTGWSGTWYYMPEKDYGPLKTMIDEAIKSENQRLAEIAAAQAQQQNTAVKQETVSSEGYYVGADGFMHGSPAANIVIDNRKEKIDYTELNKDNAIFHNKDGFVDRHASDIDAEEHFKSINDRLMNLEDPELLAYERKVFSNPQPAAWVAPMVNNMPAPERPRDPREIFRESLNASSITSKYATMTVDQARVAMAAEKQRAAIAHANVVNEARINPSTDFKAVITLNRVDLESILAVCKLGSEGTFDMDNVIIKSVLDGSVAFRYDSVELYDNATINAIRNSGNYYVMCNSDGSNVESTLSSKVAAAVIKFASQNCRK